MSAPKHKPPKRKTGWGKGCRRLKGELLDVQGAAELLGASPHFVRARAARGLLPFRKFGGRVVFVRSELELFLLALPGVSAQEAAANIAARRETA